MDLEAIQLLNLSPIPGRTAEEISEIELSTMLDHLSGLSDVNGDLTDRNVEELLKEAEDLLDKSEGNRTLDSKDFNDNCNIEEDKSLMVSQDVDQLNDNEQCNSQQSDIKHPNTPIKNDHHLPVDISSDNNTNKHYNSPAENTPNKVYSPGGSCNHIKSTIDSLREFSTLIEQTLSVKCSKSFPKNNQIEKGIKESSNVDDHLIVKPTNSKHVTNFSKTVKSPEPLKKDTCEQPLSKSIKLLNCFERLYQDRPVRLLTNKKPKTVDKLPKTVLKKKLSKDLKIVKKSNWPVKTLPKKLVKEDENPSLKTSEKMHDFALHDSADEKELIKFNKTSSQNYFSTNSKDFSPKKKPEKGNGNDFFKSSLSNGFQDYHSKSVHTKIDEKLMMKVLEGVEEIKDQVKKVSALPEKITLDDKKFIESPRSEIDLERENFCSDSVKSAGIKRLEEQFSNLKEKYNHQIEKLESENFRLRIALNNQQKIIALPMNAYSNMYTSAGVASAEPNSYTMSFFNFPFHVQEKKMENTSPGNCKTPENSPCTSPKNVRSSTAVVEAFSQTENELKSVCVQCSQECKEVGTDGNGDVLEMGKTDNKENFIMKKKLIKGKPFSDMNVHQLMKQTKAFDRETQLLATLRGLQAEVSIKEKENRKLKIEIDSLRRQIKKLANAKVENYRKSTIGTQTLGLSSFVQKPYNPENYEVRQEFEKENHELRSRLKALEMDFELLKEKRISDLQSLHQVHEEEMAKLVSKLETQSALTRHLHSLLIHR